MLVSLTSLRASAFPIPIAGRHSHPIFRGLLGVRYALRPARIADPRTGPFLEVLQLICRLLSRSECFRPERQLAGQDSHLLRRCALARHTPGRHLRRDLSESHQESGHQGSHHRPTIALAVAIRRARDQDPTPRVARPCDRDERATPTAVAASIRRRVLPPLPYPSFSRQGRAGAARLGAARVG